MKRALSLVLLLALALPMFGCGDKKPATPPPPPAGGTPPPSNTPEKPATP